MIDFLRALLDSSPLLALFLAIAAGYAIGQISTGGVPTVVSKCAFRNR